MLDYPTDASCEWEAWEAAHNTPTPNCSLSRQAIVAVLRRAFVVDFEATHFADTWPDGPYVFPVEDAAPLIGSTALLQTSKSLFAERSVTLREAINNAVDTYGRTYRIRLLDRTIGSKGRFVVSADVVFSCLNLYPYSHGIFAYVLAPILRRIAGPVGPAWYFRYQAHIQHSKRLRPRLLPHGFSGALFAPQNYGWEALECWLLKVFLFDKTPKRSNERLGALVEHAETRMKRLVSRARDEGPVAMQFFDLCDPLRRYLFWHASLPHDDREDRRRCRDLLRRLQQAPVPRIPPKEPRVVSDEMKDHYANLLREVKRVWSESRGDRTGTLRRKMLEREIDFLCWATKAAASEYGLRKQDARVFSDLLQRFWRDCGDLYALRPAEFAQPLTLIIGTFIELESGGRSSWRSEWSVQVRVARQMLRSWRKLEMQPQAIKEAFARLERRPFPHVQHLRLGDRTWEDLVFLP